MENILHKILDNRSCLQSLFLYKHEFPTPVKLNQKHLGENGRPSTGSLNVASH